MPYNIDLFNIEYNQTNIDKGKCLISEPFSPDSYFGRSVVLITEHSNENGTLGFILNKPINIPIQELIPDFPEFDAKCFIGGPVNPETIHFIHTRKDLIDDSSHIIDNVYWGRDFETLKEMIILKKISPNDVRIFLGYSGWAKEQLDNELEEKNWIVSKISHNNIMNENINLWEDILTQMGESYALWAKSPVDPNLN